MQIKPLQDMLIKILGAELNQTEIDAKFKEQLTPEIIADLLSLSKHHDLAHIVADCFRRCGVQMDAVLMSKFDQVQFKTEFRYENIKYVYGEICQTLEEACVPYIPLKGSVIRPYYPKESMRTSCDIDILIKESDLDAAIAVFTQKGYTCGDRFYHDISLYAPNNVHLELHFNIQENNEKLDRVLKDAWLYAVPTEGSAYEFTKEFFVFHMYAHMYYHFLQGGCGLRSLMDIWVLKYKMGVECEQIKELLDKAEIYKFSSELEALADICFAGRPENDFTDVLLKYLIGGGVFGTAQNRAVMAKPETSNPFKYLLKRFFLPYRQMVLQFPILKKVPILLPVYWVYRFFRLIFCRRSKTAFKEMQIATKVTQETVDEIRLLQTRMGL